MEWRCVAIRDDRKTWEGGGDVEMEDEVSPKPEQIYRRLVLDDDWQLGNELQCKRGAGHARVLIKPRGPRVSI